MTADENAAIMRRAYEAFNTADMSTLTELFDESAVWHLPGRSRFADDYQGRDATFAYFGQLGQGTAGSFRANSLPRRLSGVRIFVRTRGPFFSSRTRATVMSPSRSHSQDCSRGGWPRAFKKGWRSQLAYRPPVLITSPSGSWTALVPCG